MPQLKIECPWVYKFEDISGKENRGDDDEIQIILTSNFRRIVVTFDPTHTFSGEIANALRRYEQSNMEMDKLIESWQIKNLHRDGIIKQLADERMHATQIIEKFVLQAGRSIFSKVAPRVTKGNIPRDLHSVLNPQIILLRLSMNENKRVVLTPQEVSRTEHLLRGYMDITEDEHHGLSLNRTRRTPIYRDGCPGTKVVISGPRGEQQVTIFKGGSVKAQMEAMEEYVWLTRMMCRGGGNIRVPKLKGYMEDSNGTGIVGIMQDYIPPNKEQLLKDLASPGVQHASDERRIKWITQIEETVSRLHRLGLTWGPATASHVLIDGRTDDVWLLYVKTSWPETYKADTYIGFRHGDVIIPSKIQWFRVERNQEEDWKAVLKLRVLLKVENVDV